MYYLNGFQHSVNIIKVAVGVRDAFVSLDDERLVLAYEIFLSQDSIFENYSFSSKIKFLNFKEFSSISPLYAIKKRDHFSVNSNLLEERIKSNFFERALESLRRRSDDLYRLCMFLVRIVVLNQLNSHTNGTTFDTLGVVFLDFKDNYDQEDFIELLIHQVVHMLYFLEHRVQPHIFIEHESKMIETNLKYVRGGTAFPAYLAFHSYLVGVEILQYRLHYGLQDYFRNYHGSTDRIFSLCNKFRICMEKNANLFSDRGQIILGNASNMLDKLNSLSQVAQS